MSDALVTDFNDALGETVNRPLVVCPVVPKLHNAVEAFSAIPHTQVSMVVLKGLRDLRDLLPLQMVPECRNDRVDSLAPLGSVHHFTLRECKPFPTAVVAFEITTRVKRHEDPARLQRSDKFRRPFRTKLVIPIHEPSLFWPGVRHL